MRASIQRVKRVEEATSSKDEQLAVYVLEDLCRMAKSSPEDALHLTDNFIRKLDAKSPITKAKALKGIKYLCSKGCVEFQKAMQRKATSIRPLQNFQGTPDELKGDALNLKVREAAKEAIDAIFEAGPPQSMMSAVSSQGRMQGFGSNISNSNMGGSSLGSKMVGFGSDQYRAGMVTGGGGSSGSHLNHTPSPQPARSSLLASETSRQAQSAGHGSSLSAGVHTQQSVLGSEEQLVDSICEPGGMRVQPAREDLNRFLATCASLNGPKLAAALREKIEGQSWQESFRALCALQFVLQHGSSVSCGEIAVEFQVNPSSIEKASGSVNATVRERAHQILKMLGNSEDPDPSESVEKTPKAEPNGKAPVDLMGDLLGGLDDGFDALQQPSNLTDTREVDTASTQAQMTQGSTSNQATTAPGLDDMFSGLSIPGASVDPPSNPGLSDMDALLGPSPPQDPFITQPPQAISASGNQSSPLDAFSEPNANNVDLQPSPFTAPNPAMGQYPMPGTMAQNPAMYNPMGHQGMQGMFQNPPMYQQVGMPTQPMNPMMMNQGMPGTGMMQQGIMPQVHGVPNGMPPGVMTPQNMMPTNMMPVNQNWGQQAGMTGTGTGAMDPLGRIGSGGQAVPLAAFVGPANTKRQNSSGRNHPAFSFIGEELKSETLRRKK